MSELTSKEKLRRAHYEQMLSYASEMESDLYPEETKWHYGPAKAFYKRHWEIVEWLKAQVAK
jgi:hypothetical protein